MTGQSIVQNAFYEINAFAPGESIPAEHAAFALSKLNRLFDDCNADKRYVYSSNIMDFNLQVGHNPHTIGTAANSPDFVVPVNRPEKIEVAALILNNVQPNIFRPIRIVDDMWWLNNPVPSLETQIPYYLFYNALWPNGQVYLWPVPGFPYGLRLNIWTLLGQVTLYTAFTMPPGYEDAITLTLAEGLAQVYEKQIPLLPAKAKEARDRIWGINSNAAELRCDGAVQSMDQRPRASIANFLSGFIE